MSKMKKIFLCIGGLFATAAGVAVIVKQQNKITYLEGENKVLKDIIKQNSQDIVKRLTQQGYYNGRNAEKAAANIEEKEK